MSPTTLGLLVFASATILVWGIAYWVHEVFLKYRNSLNERLKSISGTTGSDAAVSSLFRDGIGLSVPSIDSRQSLNALWESWIERSGTRTTPFRMVILAIVLGFLSGSSVFVATILWWAGALGLIGGAILPFCWVSIKCQRRFKRLCQQLPEAFDVMSRAVRSGQTIPAAFQTIADDFAPPISLEFRICYEEQNLGIPYETALRNLARRTGIMELQILVVALLVHGRCGGNLVELLQTLSAMVRKRRLLEGKIKALTSEGRMQAVVLMILPVVAFVWIWFISPNYLAALLNRPRLLFATFSAQALGALWIRHVVQVKF